MTTHDCATGCGQPTPNPQLCKDCTSKLEDALAALATWTKAPEPLLAWCDLKTRDVHANYGRQPSSPFDTASGYNAAGKTQGVAAELDVQRARQARRGSMNGPRLAPGSKVWWPWQSADWDLNRPPPATETIDHRWRPKTSAMDRAERDLARAVATWIGLLHGVNVSAPHAVTAGHVLARGCTWLLWHVRDVTKHPRAAEAYRAFTDAAERIGKLVDRPADRVYAGPCWEFLDDGSKCPTDLYAAPGTKTVQCRSCGVVHDVAYRRGWLADHLEDVELTATNCARALATIGVTVTVSQITVWATRGLESRGRVSSGKRSLALYRVGDVMLLAYKAAEDPRAKSRSGRMSA